MPYLRPKLMAKIDILFVTKPAEEPYFGASHTYIAHISRSIPRSESAYFPFEMRPELHFATLS